MTDAEFTFKLLNRTHASRLKAINQACPIEADFTLIFDRGGDFFEWPDRIYDDYVYLGAFSEGSLVGYLMLGLFTAWVGDDFGTCVYLGDARVLPAFRGRRLTEQMMAAMEAHVPSDARLGLALVKKGNLPAESVAVSANSVRYQGQVLGDFQVLNIPLLRRVSAPSDTRVRNATVDDLEAMVQLFSRCNGRRLFAPALSAKNLEHELAQQPRPGLRDYSVAERRGRLVGMLAAWDMSPFHFTRLLRYSLSGKLFRACYKALTVMSPGSSPLPAPGGTLKTLTLTCVAIEDQNPDVLRALIAHLIEATLGKGYHLLSMGFTEGDPLIYGTEGIPFVQRFVSTLYCVTGKHGIFDKSEPLPYVDLAMI